MKTIIRIFALYAFIIGSLALVPQHAIAQERGVSFQVFYDNLSPYGNWMDYPGYGYVWMPNAGPDFSPYSTNGYWAMTDYGWTWVSEYDWGWAPFHYGRWDFNPSYGWFWIPDEVWGPAWVSWRHAPGYYGWAPLGPGMSMEMAFHERNEWREDRWRFVDEHHFGDRNMDRYYAPRERRGEYVRNSTVINNTYIDNSRHTTYISGPRREEVQKVTQTSIRPVSVRESNTPGQSLKNNQLNIYRPQVVKNDAAPERPAPKNVQRFDSRKTMPANPAQKQDMPNDRMNPADKMPAPGQPLPNRPQPNAPRQEQPQPRMEQPRQEQPQPRMEQPRQEQPQPKMEQPRPQAPQPRIEQPRQEQPQPRMEQPRMEQPRQEQPRPQPRMEQPHPQQPQPRMEPPRPQQPQPRMEQPRPQQPQPRMEQPRQEQPRMEQPRQEQPRMEQPRQEAPRQEAPRQEAPPQRERR